MTLNKKKKVRATRVGEKKVRDTDGTVQKVDHRKRKQKTLRAIRLGEGLPNLSVIMEEFQGYWDVLLGREPPPISVGTLTLMEVANAYYARAREVEKILLEGEREGIIMKGSSHYKYRTGELRSFIEMSKAAYELGSRRLTAAQMEYEPV